MVRKLLIPQVSKEDEKRAFNICLLEPVNYTIHEVSDQIGVMLELLKKTKNKEEFQRTILILLKLCENQSFLANSIVEIAKSMQEKSEEKTSEKPKVH